MLNPNLFVRVQHDNELAQNCRWTITCIHFSVLLIQPPVSLIQPPVSLIQPPVSLWEAGSIL